MTITNINYHVLSTLNRQIIIINCILEPKRVRKLKTPLTPALGVIGNEACRYNKNGIRFWKHGTFSTPSEWTLKYDTEYPWPQAVS